jgi:hypothetical protein
LFLAGAAIQLGAGIIGGARGVDKEATAASYGHNVTFTIKQNDLQGVLARGDAYKGFSG